MFELDDFLSSSNQAVLDDKFNQIPAGEYPAQVSMDDKAIEVTKGEKEGKPWAQMAVKFEILDVTGEVEKNLGRKPNITYRFFIDLDENGRPDYSKQKNVRLGQILSATGNNKPGWKGSDIKGKQCKIKITKVKDNRDPTIERSEVTMVAAA